jgi:nucleolin
MSKPLSEFQGRDRYGDREGGERKFVSRGGRDRYGGGDRYGGDRYGGDRNGGDRYGGGRSERPARRPRAAAPHPTKTLFVGNLPYNIEESEIREVFETFGEIESIRIGTDSNGRTRGFAHVEFASQNDATRAKDHCDGEGAFIQQRELRLDYAPAYQPREAGTPSPSHKLYVTNFQGDKKQLEDAFEEFSASVVEVHMFQDRETQELNGAGFINFTNVDEATKALNALKGKLDLNYARSPKPSRRRDEGSERGYRYGFSDRDDSSSVSRRESGRQFGRGSSRFN